MKTAPLLSIGMIFKNEERCIERCLQSLEPLRQAIPCELIMADTGAEDGSRAIAERYADEVFDFEWIDDFAAARNAVMDRCSGKWYLSIDCDEWLDADISELTAFLQGKTKCDFGFVMVRNYHSMELEKVKNYNDFRALRLLRMSTGRRYHGAIHEAWGYAEPAERLTNTILHHDGYLYADFQAQKEKARRNMRLLREKLKQHPDDLLVLTQCIESGGLDADLTQYLRHAVDLVLARHEGWEIFGGSIMRYAVELARQKEIPELEEWIKSARQLLPDSIFIQVDVSYSAFCVAHTKGDWDTAIRYGETYLKGLRRARAPRHDRKMEAELDHGMLSFGSPLKELTLRIGLADAYFQNHQAEKALELVSELDAAKFEPDQVNLVTILLGYIHARTMLDVGPAVSAFYDQISSPEPSGQKREARLNMFSYVASACFTAEYREQEKEQDGYWRPAYTAYRTLADRCEVGRAAAIMMSGDPTEMRAVLANVENWPALPIEALAHALLAGVPFPLEENPLTAENMDGLAAKLTGAENPARQLTLAHAEQKEYPGLPGLYWALALAMASLRSYDWSMEQHEDNIGFQGTGVRKKTEKHMDTPEEGIALLRRFAQIETAILPQMYTPQILAGENTALLPPAHRWGLYCALAFEALDDGNPQEYLAALRRGLTACPSEKDMVQFLLDRFREDTRPQASPELLALAEKVKIILAAYDSDDPAVTAIRKSSAYRQVAWLIEETPGLPVQ